MLIKRNQQDERPRPFWWSSILALAAILFFEDACFRNLQSSISPITSASHQPASCFAQSPENWSGHPFASKDRLQQIVDQLRADGGSPWNGQVPGIAATVIPADGLGVELITAVSGYSDLATKTRLQADSAFHIGSITKTFTAALILQLCQEGTLSLQDSMSTWIDGFSYGTDVTVEMLLSHTSGIPDFVSLPNHHPDDSPRDSINHVIDLAPDFLPGSSWKYSNTNFTILGLIAEEVTSSTWADLITRRFLKPLKLEHTYVWTGTPSKDTVSGYEPSCNYVENPACAHEEGFSLKKVRAENADWKVAWAAGAIVSTSADVATWMQALVTGTVLDQKHLKRMMTASPHSVAVLAQGHPYGELVWIGYGLGLCQFRIAGDRIGWGHSGAIHGGVGNVICMMDTGDTFSLLSNYGKFDARSGLGRIGSDVYEPLRSNNDDTP